MDYSGNNEDDRGRAGEIRSAYIEKMKSFIRWLVDNGRRVRLFVGDTNNADETVVEEILADLRAHRPDLDPAWVVAEPVSTFADLQRAMEPVGTVVATRYHNVVCALMLSKPTISIGYGDKSAVLMTDMGLADYCQPVNSPGRGAAHRAVHGPGKPRGPAAADDHRGQRSESAARPAPARRAVRGALPGCPPRAQPGEPAVTGAAR